MRNPAIMKEREEGTTCFNIYFSLREIYNNNKIISENAMILRVR